MVMDGTPAKAVDSKPPTIAEIKADIRAAVDKVKRLDNSRERALCVTKLQEAEMWLW